MRIRARHLAPLAILGAASAVLAGGPAAAAVKPAGGVIHVYEVDSSLTSTTGKGTFEVNTSKLHSDPRLDPKTCTFAGSSTGPVSIVAGSGTGAYRGLRGTTTTTVTTAGVLTKLTSGECNGKATPIAGFAWVRASGKVSFR